MKNTEQVHLLPARKSSAESNNAPTKHQAYMVDEVHSFIPTFDVPSDLPSAEDGQSMYDVGKDIRIRRKTPHVPREGSANRVGWALTDEAVY